VHQELASCVIKNSYLLHTKINVLEQAINGIYVIYSADCLLKFFSETDYNSHTTCICDNDAITTPRPEESIYKVFSLSASFGK
jgi:hypothetical protein